MASSRGSARGRGPLRVCATAVLLVAAVVHVLPLLFTAGGPSPASTHAKRPVALRASEEPQDVAATAVDANFEALSQIPLGRASDGAEVALPSLWADGERVVVAFLRHFG